MNINAVYFSPTGTTQKIVETIAEEMVKVSDGSEINVIDFTLKRVRNEAVVFNEKDLVVVGVPVYAGRVPNMLLNYLNSIKGNGALAVCVVLYGNRNYDDALIELRDILHNNGFHVGAACPFVGEHSFSRILAAGRPDGEDIATARLFADQIYSQILKGKFEDKVTVKGNEPYGKYYMPKDKDGNPVDIRMVTPKTKADCKLCKLCTEVCPMESIDFNDPAQLVGICIKCGACIKKCPVGAKYYDDADYLRYQYGLEDQYKDRKEPELFI